MSRLATIAPYDADDLLRLNVRNTLAESLLAAVLHVIGPDYQSHTAIDH